MREPVVTAFDTRAALRAHVGALLDRAHGTLDAFDPDFAPFDLGSSAVDAALRRFLRDGGRLRLAMHDTGHLAQQARFLRLVRDYSHAVECRRTPRTLRQLSDSFWIADDAHIVRRFHSDHARGAAAFDLPAETEVARLRFDAIWLESQAGLQASVTGL